MGHTHGARIQYIYDIHTRTTNTTAVLYFAEINGTHPRIPFFLPLLT